MVMAMAMASSSSSSFIIRRPLPPLFLIRRSFAITPPPLRLSSFISASSRLPLHPPSSHPPAHTLLTREMYISTKHAACENAWNRLFGSAAEFAIMSLVAEVICHFSGSDNLGGFQLCSGVLLQGAGFAVLPLLALSLILDDQMVLRSATASAIREAEDEQTVDLFAGMSPWQLMLIVTMDVIAEEILFRIAIQGGLAHAFLSHASTSLGVGLVSLAGTIPFFAPFAHAVAAVSSSTLIGSILFVCQGPSCMVVQARDGFISTMESKETITEWKEQQRSKRVYSSLLDSLLALYLGIEWVQTHNILAPIITHFIYSCFIVDNCLRRHRGIRRQRTENMFHDASNL